MDTLTYSFCPEIKPRIRYGLPPARCPFNGTDRASVTCSRRSTRLRRTSAGPVLRRGRREEEGGGGGRTEGRSVCSDMTLSGLSERGWGASTEQVLGIAPGTQSITSSKTPVSGSGLDRQEAHSPEPRRTHWAMFSGSTRWFGQRTPPSSFPSPTFDCKHRLPLVSSHRNTFSPSAHQYFTLKKANARLEEHLENPPVTSLLVLLS